MNAEPEPHRSPALEKLTLAVLGILGASALYTVIIALVNLSRIGV